MIFFFLFSVEPTDAKTPDAPTTSVPGPELSEPFPAAASCPVCRCIYIYIYSFMHLLPTFFLMYVFFSARLVRVKPLALILSSVCKHFGCQLCLSAMQKLWLFGFDWSDKTCAVTGKVVCKYAGESAPSLPLLWFRMLFYYTSYCTFCTKNWVHFPFSIAFQSGTSIKSTKATGVLLGRDLQTCLMSILPMQITSLAHTKYTHVHHREKVHS